MARLPRALLAAVLFVSVVTALTHIAVALTALAVILVGIYVVSIRTHPDVQCSRCNGTGKHRDWVFFWAFRGCGKCLRTGRQVRWGARLFTARGKAEHRSNVAKARAAAR